MKRKRIGMMIRIKPDRVEEYKELHTNAWDDILKSLDDLNVKNYSIFLREPENLLFSYFEYTGDDFKKDMTTIALMDITKKWWELCMPCQKPLDITKEDEWWIEMEQVFFYP